MSWRGHNGMREVLRWPWATGWPRAGVAHGARTAGQLSVSCGVGFQMVCRVQRSPGTEPAISVAPESVLGTG